MDLTFWNVNLTDPNSGSDLLVGLIIKVRFFELFDQGVS
jgi:hypothetical protein